MTKGVNTTMYIILVSVISLVSCDNDNKIGSCFFRANLETKGLHWDYKEYCHQFETYLIEMSPSSPLRNWNEISQIKG